MFAPEASTEQLMEHYDVIVIGSGPAGEKGAEQAAQFGKRVALIERAEHLGGAGHQHRHRALKDPEGDRARISRGCSSGVCTGSTTRSGLDCPCGSSCTANTSWCATSAGSSRDNIRKLNIARLSRHGLTPGPTWGSTLQAAAGSQEITGEIHPDRHRVCAVSPTR